MEKIAVFDLDGTLYKENSHIEILSEFYKTNIYKSLILKIFYNLIHNNFRIESTNACIFELHLNY